MCDCSRRVCAAGLKAKKKKARTFHGEELRNNPFLFSNYNCVLLSASLSNALHKGRKTWVLIQRMDFPLFLPLSESEAVIKGSGLEGVLAESLRLPVSGPLLGDRAWLLPPAALSSQCLHGSVALTNNSGAKRESGQEKKSGL